MRSIIPATAFAVSLGIGLSVVAGTLLSGSPAVATTVQDASATSTMATCNTLTILEDLYGSETYSSQRDDLANSLRAGIETLQDQLARLEAEINLMTAADPNRPLKIGEYNTIREQLQLRTQEAGAELQAFNAQQLIELYNVIAAKAIEIAESNGYTHLFMTRSWDQEFDAAVGVTGIIQDILARPLAYAPSANDITTEVREALGIPESDEADSAPDAAEEADADGAQPPVDPAQGTDPAGG